MLATFAGVVPDFISSTMITTDRLHIRPFTLKDAPFILELLNSPGWLEYIGDRGVRNEEDARNYLKDRLIASYTEHGFGFYYTGLVDSGEAIGMFGFAKRPFLEQPDLGFALLPAYSGKGYAVEASKAVMEYARTALNLEKLTAFTLPTNEKSIRLLERVGFHQAGPFFIPNDEEELLLMKNFE